MTRMMALCGLSARLWIVEVYKARKSLPLPLPILALPSCHVECPLSTIWHFEPQFGGITRILMHKCQAPPRQMDRFASKANLQRPLFHSNYVSMGRKGKRMVALRN